jgi:hypothetical protein
MGILDGTSTEPPKTLTVQKDGKSEEVPNPEHETWVANDKKLLDHLLNSISKDVLGQVATLATSTESGRLSRRALLFTRARGSPTCVSSSPI